MPPEIGAYAELESLTLHGHLFTELPPEAGSLYALGRLEIHRARLRSLPKEIGRLTKLETLSLDFTELTGLPPEIGSLHCRRRLSLKNCPAFAMVPPEISRCKKLTHVDLTHVPERKNLAAQLRRWLPGCDVSDLP